MNNIDRESHIAHPFEAEYSDEAAAAEAAETAAAEQNARDNGFDETYDSWGPMVSYERGSFGRSTTDSVLLRPSGRGSLRFA